MITEDSPSLNIFANATSIVHGLIVKNNEILKNQLVFDILLVLDFVHWMPSDVIKVPATNMQSASLKPHIMQVLRDLAYLS